MLDLNDFFYFVQVVDRGGFTAAGRTLRLPKSTLSHRIRQLEAGLGVRLLNRTSRRFGMTDAGGEFYRHAAEMLQQAEQAEASIRHRLSEPIGTVRFTSGTATMEFALREAVADFLVRHPKVNVVAHATTKGSISSARTTMSRCGRIQTRFRVPRWSRGRWHRRRGCCSLARLISTPTVGLGPEDLRKHSSLFMMRVGVSPTWRLRHSSERRSEVVVPLTPRLMSDDMVGLKHAAMAGLGIVALPGYVYREELRSGRCAGCYPRGLLAIRR